MQIYYPELNTTTTSATNYLNNVPANLGDVLQEEFFGAARFGVDALNAIGVKLESAFENTTLSKEEYLNSEFYREGVSVPDGGIKLSIAKLTADAYDRRFARNLTLNRARQTFGTGALRFGATLAGSVLDPLNIGVGLLAPVAIGANAAARAASAKAVTNISQRYGVTTARFAAGAGEGVAGSIAFEPVALYASDIMQDPEYGLYESFINVTAGAVFGGALTGIGGKFSDRLKNARIETQLAAARASIAQAVQGKPVDVDAPIINADPEIGPAARAEQNIRDYRNWEILNQPLRTKHKGKKIDRFPESIRRAFDEVKSGPNKGATRKPQTLLQFIKKKGGIATDDANIGEINQFLGGRKFVPGVGSIKVSSAKGGLTIDEIGEAAWEAGFFGIGTERPDVNNVLDAIEADIRGNGVIFSELDEDVEVYRSALELRDRAEKLGIDPLDMTDEQFNAEIQFRENALSDEEMLAMEQVGEGGLTREEADALISRQEVDPDDPATYIDVYDEKQSLAEFDEMRSGSLEKADAARLADDDAHVEALNKDIDKKQSQINALVANNLLRPEDLEDLNEIQDFIDSYDDFEEIANAGIACMFGGQR